jgi:hypothetical protein
VRVALVRVALVRVALVRVALVRVALVRVALVRVGWESESAVRPQQAKERAALRLEEMFSTLRSTNRPRTPKWRLAILA